MSAVIIEHVNTADLPETWRAKLPTPAAARVTVRIEEETQATEAAAEAAVAAFVTNDPAFGMWRDREDMADVEAYIRKLRAPRYHRDGTRNEG